MHNCISSFQLYFLLNIVKLNVNMAFSFSKLLSPDKFNEEEQVVIPTPTSEPKKPEPSFKELVQKMVEENKTSNTGKIEEKKAEEKMDGESGVKLPNLNENIKEEKEAEPTEIPVENIPKTEEKPVAPASKEAKLEIHQNHIDGVYFLQTIISEFSDLISAGNELQKLEIERSKVADNGKEIANKIQEKLDSRNNLRDSLVNLLTQEEDDPKLLKSALESYESYLDSVEKTYSATLDSEQAKENELLQLITEKKDQIKKLIEQVGGNESFQKIKEVVSFCKQKRQEYLDEQYKANPELKPTLVEAIRNDINQFVETDLQGSKMLLEQGNIINILMSIFAGQKK